MARKNPNSPAYEEQQTEGQARSLTKGGLSKVYENDQTEVVDPSNPRDILEAAEEIPEAAQDELAHSLGRLLAWQIDGKTVAHVGERTLVVAYKLRPDLIGAATIRQLAAKRGVKKSYIAKLVTQFRRTFGIRGINAHVCPPTGESNADKLGKGGGSTPNTLPTILNHFAEWHAFLEEGIGAVPRDRLERIYMRRDLEPLARFIAELEADL